MHLSHRPCLHDFTSVDGLEGLARECPDAWRSQLWRNVRANIDVRTTLGAALRDGADIRLLPRPAEPVRRLIERRHHARRLVECLGERPIGELGADDVANFEHWLITHNRPDTGKPLSNDGIKRSLAYARRAVEYRILLVDLLLRLRAREDGSGPAPVPGGSDVPAPKEHLIPAEREALRLLCAKAGEAWRAPGVPALDELLFEEAAPRE